MGTDAWITLGVVGIVLAMLAFTRRGPDIILFGGLTLLMVAPWHDGQGYRLGVMSAEQALAGLANPGMVTVGVLFIVAAGLRETGALGWIVARLLGRPRRLGVAQGRVMLPVAGLSAFLNNTPVVAMFIPVLADWARKLRLPISKLLIPLSYAAILGGLCTLIGTSTNLVVNGLWIADAGRASLGMFEIAWVGLPCAVAGVGYMLVIGRWLLPDRRPVLDAEADPRQYTVEMTVEPDSPLVNQTIEAAGLRHLPGMYLMEIDRDGQVLPAVDSAEKLAANDRLVFVGVVESVVDLQKIRGLTPATDQVFKLDAPRQTRCLIEAVVSDSCPVVGRTIRAGRFRSRYNAAIIAVARNGERINRKIGDIVLRPGDTLLLETRPDFVEQQRNRRDFYLVSALPDSRPPRWDRAWIAIAALVGMVAAVTTGLLSMLQAALVAGGVMIATRCLSGGEARRSVDWSLLVVIAASFGIGRAMQSTGAAAQIAHTLIGLAGDSPLIALVCVYLLTGIFTELITNNAAAVLMFPIALAAAADVGADPQPFVIAIMVAASASFATPLGYQTNLMVYGPGGYRYTDYLRVGLPLNAIMLVITCTIAPRVWAF